MLAHLVTHPRFGPVLALAAFGWGALLVLFLLFGPGLGPWTDTLLAACFGWNPATRHYRLDALILALLQPPLFGGVVTAVYTEDTRVLLRSRAGRVAVLAVPGTFLGLAMYLLATNAVSASGVPPVPATLAAPIRGAAPLPAFELVDHRGERATVETLRGRPVVMTFVYADCHASCPVLVTRLKALEAGDTGTDALFVAVTLDPARDTPAALAAYAAGWGLGSRWRLLTGRPEPVRALAAAAGVQWRRLDDGEIAHDNVLLLVDRAGRIAFTYRGLAHPAARQAADLARLVRERA
jgi:protein SCO1/2